MTCRWLLPLFLCCLAAGCGKELGGFCTSHASCRSGLRCAILAGGRGVCVYPEGVADSTASAEQGPGDLQGDLAASDAGRPERHLADSRQDQPVADLPRSEGADHAVAEGGADHAVAEQGTDAIPGDGAAPQ